MPEKPKYKCGFVLGGGGARGFAHLGVIKALEEKGIFPDIISGVSAGAVAGAFLASGKSPEESHEILKQHKITDISTLQIPKTGLFNLDKLGMMLEKHIGDIQLEDLNIPFYVAATDVLEARVKYFTTGQLSKIVQASASIPVLFSPVKIEEKFYVDGGVFSNLPVLPLLGLCEKVVIINISPLDKSDNLGNIMDIAARTFHLSVNAATHQLKDKCDLYLEPPELRKYPIFDTANADEIFELGYNFTKNLDITLFEKPSWIKKITALFNSR